MRIPRIYTEAALAHCDDVQLPEKTAHYLGRVLRMRAGRELILFNGDGCEYHATLTEIAKQSAIVHIEQVLTADRESPLSIHVGIGISRGERMDMVLQKMTELGVSHVTPLFSERSEVKLTGQRLDKKLDHWQQIVISASEQCQRNRIMCVEKPVTALQWIRETTADACFVLDHRAAEALDSTASIHSVALLIGPEGGLTDDEITAARGNGYLPLALGPRVLRTETAPLTAVSILQFIWGDLSTVTPIE